MVKAKIYARSWGIWVVSFLLISSCSGILVTPTIQPISTFTQITEGLLPDETELASLLKRMVDEEKRATGMVIGMIAPGEKVILGYGSLNEPGGPVPDGKSLFEIGSISKVFIGTLLADAVRRGEVQLDDPAGMYLPASVRMPNYNGIPITLLDLATHTSGLPRELLTDQTLTSENWVQAMYDFLSGYKLSDPPGAKFVYSNIGMTLLAHILELRTGIAYEQLLSERLLQPLGMTNTGFKPSEDKLAWLATGHNSVLYPVDAYEYNVPDHIYVGGLISNAEDMLQFASAAMGLEPTLLEPAFQDAIQPQRNAPNEKSGLGWRVSLGKYPILHHSGQTMGMHAYLGFDPQRKVAVIVLANAAVPLDDIGPHLLHPARYPLKTFSARADVTPIPVAPDILASYTGMYELEDTTITIAVQGDQLILSIPEQDSITMVAETEIRFILVEYEATVRFLVADGEVLGLVLDQAAASQSYTFTKVATPE